MSLDAVVIDTELPICSNQGVGTEPRTHRVEGKPSVSEEHLWRQTGKDPTPLAVECLSFFPSIKKTIAKLSWRPAKHVRDRRHMPFAAPRRPDATLIEHVGN